MKFTAVFVAVLLGARVADASLSSPGFEQGPNVDEVSFGNPDAAGLGWLASNTDGERFRGTIAKPAAEGSYYASLLQNSGAYDGARLGLGDFGSSGFDRVYSTFGVAPNTTYVVTFRHAGDDRFSYFADTSVVEIVDADANVTLAQSTFATPGLFDWQSESMLFTTGAGTSTAAIALTVMGDGNTSGVFDDIRIAQIPEPSSCFMGAVAVAAVVLGSSGRSKRGRCSL